jgi:DNA replication and repair protein RecF
MIITNLNLLNFRNYERAECTFIPQGAQFCGENGVGKTNLLEAIYLLSTGRSHRQAGRKEMIRNQARECFVGGRFQSSVEGRTGEHAVSFGFSKDNRSQISIDNIKETPLSEWVKQCAIISLGPEDINLIGGPPSERRRFIDVVLSQTEEGYIDTLIRYQRNVAHRNKLLAQYSDSKEMDVYEEQISACGAFILSKRIGFVAGYSDYFRQVYSDISSQRELAAMRYVASINECAGNREEDIDRISDALKKKRVVDRERGFTSVGPHRDDLCFSLDDYPVRTCASQGQKRSIAIALKIVAVRRARERRGDSLMILVDDACADLDAGRTQRIHALIQGRGQLFVTSVSGKNSFFKELPAFMIDNATLRPE